MGTLCNHIRWRQHQQGSHGSRRRARRANCISVRTTGACARRPTGAAIREAGAGILATAGPDRDRVSAPPRPAPQPQISPRSSTRQPVRATPTFRRLHLDSLGAATALEISAREQSADHRKLALPTHAGSPHDPLRSPVVNSRCFGRGVDRCAGMTCCQHRDHSLDRLRGPTTRVQTPGPINRRQANAPAVLARMMFPIRYVA
jgi:hypothetical protein